MPKNHWISDLSEKNLHVKQNLKCHILLLFSDKDLPYIGNINFEPNVQNHKVIENSKTHKKTPKWWVDTFGKIKLLKYFQTYELQMTLKMTFPRGYT